MIEQFQDEIALIRYHMSYPGSDPFYQFNPEENSARLDYYEVTSTSHLYIDGIVDAGNDYPEWEGLFQECMDVPSPMEIDITGTYDSDERAVSLEISVTATDEIILEDLRLQCVTVENGIHQHAPNGLEIHNQVMRDMVPDPEGEAFSISNGETVEFAKEFTLNNELNADSCEFVIFVQAHSRKNVLQAGKIKLPELDPTVIRNESGRPPMACGLFQNCPNPFNTTTALSYILPRSGTVTISVYNLLGRRVASVFEGNQQAGSHTLIWDAGNIPSGVYFARLEAGEFSQSVKMVLLK